MAFLREDGYTLTLKQNSSFNLLIGLHDRTGTASFSPTGWSVTGSIKHTYDDTGSLMYFSCSLYSVPSASISMSLTGDQTWALGNAGTRFVYDVIANNNSMIPHRTYRLLGGRLKVRSGVTQP